jgi:hypothetical protein
MSDRPSESWRTAVTVNDALVDIIPLTIATAITPLMVILILTMLRGERGLSKAGAFLAGVVAVRLAQGVVFGLLLGSPDDAAEESAARTITSTLLLVLGLLMVITALRVFFNEEDPDEPPPKWKTAVVAASPLNAFVLGAFVMVIAGKHWVFTLSALSVLREADISQAEGIALFLLYVAVASLPLLTPILSLTIAPQSASRVLDRIGAWLDTNNRAIKIVVSAGFGAYFLVKGVTAIVG